MPAVVIVDHGLCNLDSIRRALEECGATTTVTSQPDDVDRADRLVLPGVGAFGDAMDALRSRGLDTALTDRVVDGGVPFLGICLGMQLLAEVGHEGSPTKGLGWIDGEVVRLEPLADERIPHVGWNEVDPTRPSTLLAGVPPHADFYFVHSYRLLCRDDGDAVGVTPYCGGFTSIVERRNVFGVQFHPEKSQENGFTVLRNFLAAPGC